jgi:hypothetical protein
MPLTATRTSADALPWSCASDAVITNVDFNRTK